MYSLFAIPKKLSVYALSYEHAGLLMLSIISYATFNMLIPYPETSLFKRLEKENRIPNYEWLKYNGRTEVTFTPENLTCEELLTGFKKVNRHFYS